MRPTSSAPSANGAPPTTLDSVRQHPMLRDVVSVVALAAAALLNLITLIVVLIKVRSVSYPVPTHYLSLVGFDQTGSWYATYRFAAFGVVVTIINGLLAAKSFQRHRLTSFFLLLGAAVVGLLCLVISGAFAGIE
jgi:hypothetical protein